MSIVYACISPHPPVIVPEVGGGRELTTQRTVDALRQVAQELSHHTPQTAVLIATHGPVRVKSFGILTTPTAEGDFAIWGAPDVAQSCAIDLGAVSAISQQAQAAGLPLRPIERWNEGSLDWSCTVPLYYLRPGLPADARFVFLCISLLPPADHFALGQAVARALAGLDSRAAIVASADLSHRLAEDGPYGYHPAGPALDERLRQAIARWDVATVLETDDDLRELAGDDAVSSISVLMGALDGLKVRPRVLSYEGPFGVGYMVAAIDVVR